MSAQKHNTVLARAQTQIARSEDQLANHRASHKKWKAPLIFPQIKTTREIRKSGNKKFNKQSNGSVEFFAVIRKQTWNGHVLRRLWNVEFFVLPFGIERRRCGIGVLYSSKQSRIRLLNITTLPGVVFGVIIVTA